MLRPRPLSSPIILFTLGGLAACAGRPPAYDYAREPDPNKIQYVLGPGDVIDIRQWKNPDVSGKVRIMPDGTITVPLLGQVMAAGLTVRKLRDMLSTAFSRFITQPAEMQTLTVSVDEYQGYTVSVLGEVNQPGHYQPGHYVTILEALALSRGLSPYARGDDIVIIRSHEGVTRRIPISYSALTRGRRNDMNIYLLRGDVVVVP